MTDELRSALAIARDEWLASAAGKSAAEGEAAGIYLRHRVENAFCAGWQAAQHANWIKRGCQSRTRHATEAKAIKAASRTASKAKGASLRVYHCTHCAGWHLTHWER